MLCSPRPHACCHLAVEKLEDLYMKWHYTSKYLYLYIFFGCPVGKKDRGFCFYSSDWSMRSCLRTLVWLVSLISPARNISSTTVYTLEGKKHNRQGQKWERKKKEKPRVHGKLGHKLSKIASLKKCFHSKLKNNLSAS